MTFWLWLALGLYGCAAWGARLQARRDRYVCAALSGCLARGDANTDAVVAARAIASSAIDAEDALTWRLL